jgi:hypothetical protein
MKRLALFSLLASLGAGLLPAQNDTPLLLQSPTLSKTQIAFAYGGSLWVVARDGGEARMRRTRRSCRPWLRSAETAGPLPACGQ